MLIPAGVKGRRKEGKKKFPSFGQGLYKRVSEAASNAIVVIDKRGRMVFVNSQTEKLFGYSREVLMGKEVETLVPERFRSKHRGFVQDFFKEPQIRAIGTGRDLLGLKKDGTEVPIEIGLNPITTNEGTFVLASVIDITERKRAEGLREQLVAQLESANKELEAFAYVVSHDLKAPLRGINLLAEWIEEDLQDKLDQEGKKQLELLRGRVQRMHTLIDGVLEYSQIGRVKRELAEVNLNELLREVVDLIAPPGHIRVEIQKNLPRVRAERTRMHQLFQNLIDNAVKFMDKPQGKIEIGCQAAGPMRRFYVADNGPGIEAKYFDKIFQLFLTLESKGRTGGTGVGLALARRIVETYGGRMWVESKLGGGVAFFFTLPK